MARILVIEDDPEVRELLEETLRRAGHEVLSAANGKDAIPLFRANPVEVIIADMLMPEKDGLETIAELRSISPNVKIIAISGARPELMVLSMAEKLGAVKTLAKPFRPDEVIDVVEKLLITE